METWFNYSTLWFLNMFNSFLFMVFLAFKILLKPSQDVEKTKKNPVFNIVTSINIYMHTYTYMVYILLCDVCLRVCTEKRCFYFSSKSKNQHFESFEQSDQDKVQKSKNEDSRAVLKTAYLKHSKFLPLQKIYRNTQMTNSFFELPDMNSWSSLYGANGNCLFIYYFETSVASPDHSEEKISKLDRSFPTSVKDESCLNDKQSWNMKQNVSGDIALKKASNSEETLSDNAAIPVLSELASFPHNTQQVVGSEIKDDSPTEAIPGMVAGSLPGENAKIPPEAGKRKARAKKEEKFGKRCKKERPIKLLKNAINIASFEERGTNIQGNILDEGNQPSIEPAKEIVHDLTGNLILNVKSALTGSSGEVNIDPVVKREDLVESLDSLTSLANPRQATQHCSSKRSTSSPTNGQHSLYALTDLVTLDYQEANETRPHSALFCTSPTETEVSDFEQRHSISKSKSEHSARGSVIASTKHDYSLKCEIGESSREIVIKDIIYKPYPGPIGITGFVKKDSRYQKKFYKMKRLLQGKKNEVSEVQSTAIDLLTNATVKISTCLKDSNKNNSFMNPKVSSKPISKVLTTKSSLSTLPVSCSTGYADVAFDKRPSTETSFARNEDMIHNEEVKTWNMRSQFVQSELAEADGNSFVKSVVSFVTEEDILDLENLEILHCRDHKSGVYLPKRSSDDKIALRPLFKIWESFVCDICVVSAEEFMYLLRYYEEEFHRLANFLPEYLQTVNCEICYPQVPIDTISGDTDDDVMDLNDSLVDQCPVSELRVEASHQHFALKGEKPFRIESLKQDLTGMQLLKQTVIGKIKNLP